MQRRIHLWNPGDPSDHWHRWNLAESDYFIRTIEVCTECGAIRDPEYWNYRLEIVEHPDSGDPFGVPDGAVEIRRVSREVT